MPNIGTIKTILWTGRQTLNTCKIGSSTRKTSSVNYRNEAELIAGCPLAAAMKLVGGRWKLMLLWYVRHGVDRYGRLRAVIPHISEKMLYQQLRELERDGLMIRVMNGRAVSYALTELAVSLTPVLAQLEAWSRDNKVAERLLSDSDEIGEAAIAVHKRAAPG